MKLFHSILGTNANCGTVMVNLSLTLSFSSRDNRISYETLVSSLRAMSIRQYILEVEELFGAGNYSEIICRLHPIFQNDKEDLDSWHCPLASFPVASGIQVRHAPHKEKAAAFDIAKEYVMVELSEKKRLQLFEFLWEVIHI
jgi:hypothetical protein